MLTKNKVIDSNEITKVAYVSRGIKGAFGL